MWTFLLFACSEDVVRLSGIVFDGPGTAAAPLPGAEVSILSPDDASVLASATTDGEGVFSVEVGPGLNLFALIEADGYRPSTFPGTTGLQTEQVVERNALYAMPEADVAALEATFAGCGGSGVGVTFGEVRIYEIATVEDGEHPTTGAARVHVLTEGGDDVTACYWNSEGTAWDPAALVTGDQGSFVLPGLPAGVHTIEISYDLGAGVSETQQYPMLVLETGNAVPWFPAWVSLPQ